jgi:hypothetical protein
LRRHICPSKTPISGTLCHRCLCIEIVLHCGDRWKNCRWQHRPVKPTSQQIQHGFANLAMAPMGWPSKPRAARAKAKPIPHPSNHLATVAPFGHVACGWYQSTLGSSVDVLQQKRNHKRLISPNFFCGQTLSPRIAIRPSSRMSDCKSTDGFAE